MHTYLLQTERMPQFHTEEDIFVILIIDPFAAREEFIASISFKLSLIDLPRSSGCANLTRTIIFNGFALLNIWKKYRDKNQTI